MPETSNHRRSEVTAGILNLVAGAGHVGVTADHFAEWVGYGLFFLAAATGQVVLGLALLTRAINPTDSGPKWRTLQQWMYATGAIGNAVIIVMYIVTRTVGIPWVGPAQGEVEAPAVYDVVVTLAEVVAVFLLVLLWRSARRALRPVGV